MEWMSSQMVHGYVEHFQLKVSRNRVDLGDVTKIGLSYLSINL